MRNISAFSEIVGGLGDGLAHGFAGQRQRGLADLLLALGKMEIQRTPRRSAGGQNVVQCGAVIALLAKQFCRGGQGFPFGIRNFFLPSLKISVANRYIDLHHTVETSIHTVLSPTKTHQLQRTHIKLL